MGNSVKSETKVAKIKKGFSTINLVSNERGKLSMVLPCKCLASYARSPNIQKIPATIKGAVPLETAALNRRRRSYAMYLFLVVCSMYAYFVVAVETDTNR